MARVLVATQPWGVLFEKAVSRVLSVPLSGVLAAIDTTVYSGATGGGTIAPAAFVSGSDGALPGYVAHGTWQLTVGGVTRQVDAVSAANVEINASDYGVIPNSVLDQTTGLQLFLNAAAAAGRGVINASPLPYLHGDLTVPSTLGEAGGCVITGAGPGVGRTQLEYTGTGIAISIGDGGTFTTNYQFLENIELIGNASADGGVRFNGTRWCGVRRCYIHGFTQSGAEAVVIDDDEHNYFNEIDNVWFADNYRHVTLRGDAGGTGANSNRVVNCTFNPSTGDAQVVIDGGDTNRIEDNEFDGVQAVSIKVLGTALYNRIERNQFDGPTKAWDLASGVTLSQMLWNTGAAATLNASTDAGTMNVRRDIHTESARVSVYNSANQSITTGSVTTLTWNSENFDPAGMHSTSVNTDRLTVAVPGTYRISGHLWWAGTDPDGVRMLRVTKSGTSPVLIEISGPASPGGELTGQPFSVDVPLVAGDYVICRVYQDSGATLALQGGNTPGCQLHMQRIAD